MKFVQISRNPLSNFGGVEVVARHIHQLLFSRPQFKVFTYSLVSHEQAKSTCFKNEYFIPSFLFAKGKFPRLMTIPRLFQLTYCLLRAEVILIHLPDPFSALIAIIFAIFGSGKVFIYWHSDIPDHYHFYKAYSILSNLALQFADSILTSSPKLARESLFISLNKLISKVHVIPLFHESPSYLPHLTTPLHDRSIDCIYVGRTESYKNLKVLIDSFCYSSASSLFICGQGFHYDFFQEYAASVCPLEKNISFVPSPSDIKKYQLIATSKVLILPSNTLGEAFGLVQLEAFSVGTPVISMDIFRSGVSWVNQNNVTGFTVDPDTNDFSSIIDKILDSPVLWSRFSVSAIERAHLFSTSSFDRLFLSLC